MNKIFLPKIDEEQINALPLQVFEGEIFFVDTIEKFNEILPDLINEKILGFDTETKPSFQKGVKNKVALLQLSSDKKAWLFKIHAISLPSPLLKILSDKTILKIGVAIHDDIKFLQSVSPFKPQGFVELQTYVKEFGIEDAGLRKLVGNVLGFRISKSARLTNWESVQLNDKQKTYAATDAWVSRQVYIELNKSNQ